MRVTRRDGGWPWGKTLPVWRVRLALWFHFPSNAVGLHPIATLQTEAQHTDCADPRPRANENCCLWTRNVGRAGKEWNMLWTIAVVLVVLWLLGLVSSYTMGGFVHLLLVLAVIVVLVRIIQGRSLTST